jgi:hypothetical protein
MSGNRDTDNSGEHRRFGVNATVAAATLTLIAAIIGLITVLANDDGGSSASPTPSGGTEKSGTGGHEDSTERSGGGNGAGSAGPADGNSRASAKPLVANRPIESSLIAGNDVDWFVYQAEKSETATVEFVKGGEFVAIPTTNVTVFEDVEVIDQDYLQSTSEPLVVRRIVSPETRLYVEVVNECGGGCGLGPYKVGVRTGPPG